jgi:hypothetical protein
MPWKECSVMDERLQFVTELCREFGISRKIGYKIFDRYQECGVEGLTDRSRRPCAASLQAYVVRPTGNGPVGVGRPPGVIQPPESELSLAAIKVQLAFSTEECQLFEFLIVF